MAHAQAGEAGGLRQMQNDDVVAPPAVGAARRARHGYRGCGVNQGKWVIYEDSGVSHIIPLEDIEPHFQTIDCHCHPERHPETTGRMVVHNSFDGREKSEQ